MVSENDRLQEIRTLTAIVGMKMKALQVLGSDHQNWPLVAALSPDDFAIVRRLGELNAARHTGPKVSDVDREVLIAFRDLLATFVEAHRLDEAAIAYLSTKLTPLNVPEFWATTGASQHYWEMLVSSFFPAPYDPQPEPGS